MPRTIEKRKETENEGHEQVCEAVGRSFDRAFERSGANKKTVTATFEAALEGLRKAKKPESRLRSIAKSAAISTGRCHGNVIETGRTLLDQTEALSKKHGFKYEIARDQILLGLAEGACQIGPVVYCRFLEVADSYKEGAEDWICRNRRLPAVAEPNPHPVIVPYHDELTLKTESVKPAPTLEPKIESAPLPEPEKENWSRPKQRGIFRRLTEAVGHFFGG